jgi:hypothetical protein
LRFEKLKNERDGQARIDWVLIAGGLYIDIDLARAAVWLASEECFMTGENLQVNGGFVLRRHPTKEEIAATGTTLTYQEGRVS